MSDFPGQDQTGRLEALLHKDRRRANLKNQLEESVEQAILTFAIDNPAAGQVRVSNECARHDNKQPLSVRSNSGFDMDFGRETWPISSFPTQIFFFLSFLR